MTGNQQNKSPCALITAVQPAAMALTNGRSRQLRGKFQGPMINAHPRGSGLMVILAIILDISPGQSSGRIQYFRLSIAKENGFREFLVNFI